MPSQNYEKIEKELERKQAQREKKLKPKMKVSGAGVKELSRIIRKKDKTRE